MHFAASHWSAHCAGALVGGQPALNAGLTLAFIVTGSP